ncbi:MAG: Rhs element Vgr protein, partial [Bacteroidota bacterium]
MNNAQTLPDNSVHGVVSFDLLVGDNAVDPTVEVLAVQVAKSVNRVPFARINLRDGSAEEATFSLSEGETFVPGKEVEVKVGYDQNNETVFKGVIVKQRIKFKANGESYLQVECQDKAFAMTLGRKNRYFTDVKDSDAYGEIIAEYGLSSELTDTSVTHRELVQYHASDWDFLLTRAEANGHLVLAADGKITVAPPKVSGSPKLQLSFGGNLLAFDAEMDARHQWKSVTAQAWNPTDQALFEATSESVDFTENGNLSGQKLSEVGGLDTFALRHAGFLAEDELQ